MSHKRAGFFREVFGDESLPSLSEARQAEPQDDETKIISYLESGSLLVASPGPAFDPLSEPRQIAGAQHIMHDGIWSWPSSLPDFVMTYHCKLPSDFVDHMKANDWQAEPIE